MAYTVMDFLLPRSNKNLPTNTCGLLFFILDALQEAESANVPPPKYSSTGEMAYTVMDVLFASRTVLLVLPTVCLFGCAIALQEAESANVPPPKYSSTAAQERWPTQ
jgi:hypothetical protein